MTCPPLRGKRRTVAIIVSGLLSFPAVDAAGNRTLDGASTVTLVICNLAGVPLRTFTWTLGGS